MKSVPKPKTLPRTYWESVAGAPGARGSKKGGELRRVVLTVAATAVLALAGATGAFAGLGGPNAIDSTMAGGYFSGGTAGRGYVKITRVHPNPNTGCISLRLRLNGWQMYPGKVGTPVNDFDGGHYHVYVNGKYHNFGSNPTRARACGLAGGRTYSLRVILANNDHSELRARSQLVSATLG
jgi:hypothetical protein